MYNGPISHPPSPNGGTPSHKRLVALPGVAFRVSATAVTNAQFASFVRATGHLTDAERVEYSHVYEGFLSEPDGYPWISATPWWRAVPGATWERPFGPGSNLKTLQNHPVVHVSWNDAQAYCAWSGTRLPSETEWEYAARGGLERKRYPWGDELTPGGQHMCNVWQGDFPKHNTAEDGYLGTAPAKSFPPNGFGLYNMAGNVWEWCADWYQSGESRVMRGGSHMCHEACDRGRVSARCGKTPDSSTGSIGFRVVA